jgi:hypothetical protein
LENHLWKRVMYCDWKIILSIKWGCIDRKLPYINLNNEQKLYVFPKIKGSQNKLEIFRGKKNENDSHWYNYLGARMWFKWIHQQKMQKIINEYCKYKREYMYLL